MTHLWVPDGNGNSGYIGVVSATSGPMMTNSFALLGGTNLIVSQFSWDPSLLGYRLETLVAPNSVGLSANTNYVWTSAVAGSWTNTTETITNVIGTNCVFYRLVFP